MATKDEYAQLSLYVYNATGRLDNRPLEPAGWERLEYHPDGGLGFSYGVFRRIGTTEVVVAYAGTNSGIDWIANVKNGIGLSSTQTTEAALAYLTAKQTYGSNITFTGHSLGGGLASIMAVWFDRPATVFDEAPFEMTARSPWVLPATKAALALAGFSDAAFTGYTGLLDFYARESQVTNYYLDGEALAALRLALPTVMGQDNAVLANSGVTGAIDLHSQSLLTSMLMSETFRQSTYVSSRVIPLLMDNSLYAYDAKTSNQQNVLINFIRSEQGAGDKLTHFAADMQKIGASIASLDIKAQDALIAQAIEWYYWQGAGYAGEEFFTRTGDLLQYTTATGAGLAGAQNKVGDYVGKWLAPYTLPYGESFMSSYVSKFDQWNVATGNSGVTATARDATKTQIFLGSAGADNFTGGQKADILFGGDSADNLNGGDGEDKLYGGKGNDTLIGGAGIDTYIINSGDGIDTLIDSGINRIIFDGKPFTGTFIKNAGTGEYEFLDDTSKTIKFNSPGTLTLDADTQIIFQNQTTAQALDGSFGIQLFEEGTAAPTPLTLTGDIKPEDTNPGKAGIQAAGDANGNPVGTAQPYSDILGGSAGNDHIQAGELDDDVGAGAGDDWVEGGSGKDWLRGEAGNDLIEGGTGRDILIGEDGDDRLYANAQMDITTAIANGDTDTATGQKGDWLTGNAGDDTLVAGADNDVLAGGTGADLLIAGAGDDYILGDADYIVQFIPEGAPRYTLAGTDWYHSDANTFNWTVTPGANPGDATVFAPVYGETNPAGGGDDVIYAGAGSDHVWAGEGNDYVDGNGGYDPLFGGAGNDEIGGTSKADVPCWESRRHGARGAAMRHGYRMRHVKRSPKCPARVGILLHSPSVQMASAAMPYALYLVV